MKEITRENIADLVRVSFIIDDVINEPKNNWLVSKKDERLNLNRVYYIFDANTSEFAYVTKSMLDKFDLTVDEINFFALENEKQSELKYTSLGKFTKRLLRHTVHPTSVPSYDLNSRDNDIIVIKGIYRNDCTKDEYNQSFPTTYSGAAIIYNNKLLDRVCERMHQKEIIIAPFSIHELICIPAYKVTDLNDLIKLMKNNTQGLPLQDRMTETPFIYKKGGQVEICNELSFYADKDFETAREENFLNAVTTLMEESCEKE